MNSAALAQTVAAFLTGNREERAPQGEPAMARPQAEPALARCSGSCPPPSSALRRQGVKSLRQPVDPLRRLAAAGEQASDELRRRNAGSSRCPGAPEPTDAIHCRDIARPP